MQTECAPVHIFCKIKCELQYVYSQTHKNKNNKLKVRFQMFYIRRCVFPFFFLRLDVLFGHSECLGWRWKWNCRCNNRKMMSSKWIQSMGHAQLGIFDKKRTSDHDGYSIIFPHKTNGLFLFLSSLRLELKLSQWHENLHPGEHDTRCSVLIFSLKTKHLNDPVSLFRFRRSFSWFRNAGV